MCDVRLEPQRHSPVTVGLHQGLALSPFLFAMIMDCLAEEVGEYTPWQIMFADGVVLCANCSEKLEPDLETWRAALETRGLNISRKKTKYLCLHSEEAEKIQLLGDLVPKAEESKYLGSMLTEPGTSGREVRRRVESGWRNWKKVRGVLRDKKVPTTVYSTVVQPAMLYVMKVVLLSVKQEK